MSNQRQNQLERNLAEIDEDDATELRASEIKTMSADEISESHNGFRIDGSPAAQFMAACIREAARKLDFQIGQEGNILDLRALEDASLQRLFAEAERIAARGTE